MISRMVLTRLHGRDSALTRALGDDRKGRLSPFVYLAAIGLSFVDPRIAQRLYAILTLIWLASDKRFEQAIGRI